MESTKYQGVILEDVKGDGHFTHTETEDWSLFWRSLLDVDPYLWSVLIAKLDEAVMQMQKNSQCKDFIGIDSDIVVGQFSENR